MGLAALPFIREWILSWAALARNKGYALASALVDALFFIAFGFLTGPVFAKLTEHVIIIGTLVSSQMRSAAGRARPAVIDALFQQPVSRYTWQFLGLLALLLVTVFVLYCALHGLNWWLATSVAGKKTHWRDFLLRFARVNALWFALYVAWYCLDTVFDLRRLVVEKLSSQPAQGPAILLTIALVAIGYFAIVSYPLLNVRKAFALGIRAIPTLVPAFLLVAAHALVGNFIVRWLATVNAAAHFIIGIILLLVLLAWARLYIARVVRAAHGV